MRKYKVGRNADMGFCAMMKEDGMAFWQQVSLWYTTLGRLNKYWGEPNCIKLKLKEVVEVK